MEQELKPCPFCGNNNIEIVEINGKYNKKYAICRCIICGSQTRLHLNKEKAVFAWNNRIHMNKNITGNSVHLCLSCYYNYPDCPSENIIFGDGVGNDNICCCASYDPLWTREMEEHIDKLP